MKSETAWKKSQQFGGMTSIAAGILILAGIVFLRGTKCTFYGLTICAIMLVADVFYSYRASKNENF